jgi:aspartate kinase
VVSAMGKTTNSLERLAKAFFYKTENADIILEEVKKYHLDICQHLFANSSHPIFIELENTFVELYWAIEDEPTHSFDFEYDQIVSMGEIISTKIISAYLNDVGLKNKWIDARGLIQTDNSYREGNVDFALTESLIKRDLEKVFNSTNIIVTQGFIGGTSENFTTTLGREGSDYTASILAYCLNAENVTIWKDVPGMLNADPKYFDETIKLDEISFKEAIELAYYGATVIHPKTIKPLQNKEIPLLVKSFIEPQKDGTIIQSSTKNDALIPSYIFKVNQILISLTPKDFSFIVEENLSEIFRLLAVANAKINVMQNSAVSFHLLLDEKKTDLPKLLKIFGEKYNLKYDQGLEVVTIRHYNDDTIEKVTENKEILLQQKTRQTARLVMRNID